MKRTLTGIVGVVLIIAGLAGLVFAGLGLVAVARAEQQVETMLMEQVDLMDRALAATADGLVVADATLTQAVAAMSGLEALTDGLELAIDGTAPTLDAVAEMLGDQLPATIRITQDTLETIAETTQMVDTFLGIVTSIPLLGLDRYNPEVPLSSGVLEVASSLDGIPRSLSQAQAGLISASDNLESMQTGVAGMASEVGQIVASLEASKMVIQEYRTVVADMQGLVVTVRQGLPDWLRWGRWGLSLILIWLGIAQLGLITQGWELLARSRRNRD